MIPATLTPVPPAEGASIEPDPERPNLLAGGPGDSLLILPAAPRGDYATFERRDAAWWLRPGRGVVELNGVVLRGELRVVDGDVIRVGGSSPVEFASGEEGTRRQSSPAAMIARPRRRASGPLPRGRKPFSWAAAATTVLAVLMVAGAVAVAWYAFRAPRTVSVLSDRQAAELDSLLVTAYDHVERGGTLLELGLGDGAAQEFAQAINTLELSDLRNNPQVKPRIEALSASVASIYRERSLAVPENYAHATSPLTPEQLKTASLTVDEFAAKFGLMAETFKATFGHEIVVSGRDHAEHVILYGKGGAMDLSIKSMTAGEVAWIVDKAHALHIRVKDFSRDSVLRRQVASAVRKGLLFEAGTGLHIHIDRFANKRDRWTTLGPPDSSQSATDLFQRGAAVRIRVARRDERG